MRILTFLLCFLQFAVLSGQQQTDFEKYISNFEPILKDTICNTDLVPSRREIDKLFVQRFLTKENDCECEKGTVWYRYQKVMKYGNFLVAFVNKDCDVPQKGYYPFNENVLYVYTTKGKIVDSKVISRSGDMWQYTLTGTQVPFKLVIEQASEPINEWERKMSFPVECTVETSAWSISAEGLIEKQVLSVQNGVIRWDNSEKRRVIVKLITREQNNDVVIERMKAMNLTDSLNSHLPNSVRVEVIRYLSDHQMYPAEYYTLPAKSPNLIRTRRYIFLHRIESLRELDYLRREPKTVDGSRIERVGASGGHGDDIGVAFDENLKVVQIFQAE